MRAPFHACDASLFICFAFSQFQGKGFGKSQIAALFVTMIGTMIPAVQFSGMLTPVSSLEGAGRLIGQIYPTSHMLTISRGVFSKALSFTDLHASFWPLALAFPIIIGVTVMLLKKQET